LSVDFDGLCSRRILHLINPGEATELIRQGADFQMHCHRHRVYKSRPRFLNELKENSDIIQTFGAPTPRHFCYPGGYRLPEFDAWLEEFGAVSATTCEYGLATRRTPPYEIPRMMDLPGIPLAEFEAWVSGAAAYLPRRHTAPPENQLIEETSGEKTVSAL
jgi:peptidoglycan/xylan/chitin deacetylase (PgdA/CDA1 family)